MRYLIVLLIAGLLVGCGGGGSSTGVKQDGRIYVENAWRADSGTTGPCIMARLEKVDEQVVSEEEALQDIPYQAAAPVEITSEFGAVPGGSTATVHIRTVCGRTLDWSLPFPIDGSIVIKVTSMVPAAHDLRYEVRSIGR